MSSFKDRKESRKQHYEKCVKGWKQKSCIACNGSGRYDYKGKRGACNGTGKEFFKPILT